ncbi:hypothetical protein PBCV1_a186L [Paramecium bursaria Chlorella virus 1]|uniref:Uncharacterized protein n=1 Tax=Paramecium bursaria Chlorella virus 1 TaxID=10506 RepID=Q84506_PBCV1|nr:hypothetical protein PBCV1_a186L [Paramecium bursaria Chlorella virus 1]AAC96554.1 hypothetical protein [Paramecium bursaria Chlorella virus 1]
MAPAHHTSEKSLQFGYNNPLDFQQAETYDLYYKFQYPNLQSPVEELSCLQQVPNVERMSRLRYPNWKYVSARDTPSKLESNLQD